MTPDGQTEHLDRELRDILTNITIDLARPAQKQTLAAGRNRVDQRQRIVVENGIYRVLVDYHFRKMYLKHIALLKMPESFLDTDAWPDELLFDVLVKGLTILDDYQLCELAVNPFQLLFLRDALLTETVPSEAWLDVIQRYSPPGPLNDVMQKAWDDMLTRVPANEAAGDTLATELAEAAYGLPGHARSKIPPVTSGADTAAWPIAFDLSKAEIVSVDNERIAAVVKGKTLKLRCLWEPATSGTDSGVLKIEFGPPLLKDFIVPATQLVQEKAETIPAAAVIDGIASFALRRNDILSALIFVFEYKHPDAFHIRCRVPIAPFSPTQ